MFLVICTTEELNWQGVGTLATGPFPAVRRIPVNRQPTVIYDERETAEREAERLALKHPGESFSVFGRITEVERGTRESTLGPVTLALRYDERDPCTSARTSE